MVVDFLAAVGTIIKLHLGDGVSPTFVFAGYIPHYPLDFVAAAGRAPFVVAAVALGYLATSSPAVISLSLTPRKKD